MYMGNPNDLGNGPESYLHGGGPPCGSFPLLSAKAVGVGQRTACAGTGVSRNAQAGDTVNTGRLAADGVR